MTPLAAARRRLAELAFALGVALLATACASPSTTRATRADPVRSYLAHATAGVNLRVAYALVTQTLNAAAPGLEAEGEDHLPRLQRAYRTARIAAEGDAPLQGILAEHWDRLAHCMHRSVTALADLQECSSDLATLSGQANALLRAAG